MLSEQEWTALLLTSPNSLHKPCHVAVPLNFAKSHMDKHKDFCNRLLWSDKTKIEILNMIRRRRFGTKNARTKIRKTLCEELSMEIDGYLLEILELQGNVVQAVKARPRLNRDELD